MRNVPYSSAGLWPGRPAIARGHEQLFEALALTARKIESLDAFARCDARDAVGPFVCDERFVAFGEVLLRFLDAALQVQHLAHCALRACRAPCWGVRPLPAVPCGPQVRLGVVQLTLTEQHLTEKMLGGCDVGVIGRQSFLVSC